MLKLIFTFLLITLIPVDVNALNNSVMCSITPEAWSLEPRPNIYLANNLRRYIGSPEFAQGNFITIKGKILDSNCVPVTGALVQIWHTDSKGVYKYSIDGPTYLNKRLMYVRSLYNNPVTTEHRTPDKNFTGSGSVKTDNLGNYKFMTIMPGVNNIVPVVHFHISHNDFSDMETVMFFPDSIGSMHNDAIRYYTPCVNEYLVLENLIAARKTGDTKDDIYEFNITLNGEIKYKSY